MYCPACGAENGQAESRFCRSCGADLRAVVRALNNSLPAKIATSIDTYLENRYQQNMRTGVMNIIAFVALLLVGGGHLIFGWTKMAVFMLALSAISLFFGIWDIWIYRRNLPPNSARQSALSSTPTTNQLDEPRKPLPIAEPTTRNLKSR